MKTRKLRELTVSEVGMGCMAFSHGCGKIPTEQYSIEAIRGAYDHGCTFFDTAEVYSPGLSGTEHNELFGEYGNDIDGMDTDRLAFYRAADCAESGLTVMKTFAGGRQLDPARCPFGVDIVERMEKETKLFA